MDVGTLNPICWFSVISAPSLLFVCPPLSGTTCTPLLFLRLQRWGVAARTYSKFALPSSKILHTCVSSVFRGSGVRTVSEEGFSETPATRASSLAGRRRPAFGTEVFKISTNNTILNEAARFPSSFHPYPPYLIRSWRSSERTSWNGATSSRRMTTSCGGLRCWWDR